MNDGWRCPGCGKIYAPHIDECPNCNNNDDTYVPTPIPPQPPWIYNEPGNYTVWYF